MYDWKSNFSSFSTCLLNNKPWSSLIWFSLLHFQELQVYKEFISSVLVKSEKEEKWNLEILLIFVVSAQLLQI